jgi:hypothetical protein
MKKLILSIFLVIVSKYSFAQSPLCASTSTNFCCEYVANITINGKTYLGNTGFSGPGYYDYTGNPVPNINAGDNITLSYTVTTNGPYRQYFKFWFDFNGNGLLNDPGELVHEYDEVINNTTKTLNHTFTVPNTVFNGPVYMRFIMVFSSSPTLCGNYAYGNTFDFSTTITGAVQPPQYFSHYGVVNDASGNGISGIPLELYKKSKSQTSYFLHDFYITDSCGNYSIVTNLDTTVYNFQLKLPHITLGFSPSPRDAAYYNEKIFSNLIKGKDYYMGDINRDNSITISDVYMIFQKINGNPWQNSTPSYLYFDSTIWNTIYQSTSNLRNLIPGSQFILIVDPISSDTTNFNLIRTGFEK